MEQNNNIEQSEIWKQIHNIVKQIPRTHTVGDAPDAPSVATELEELFLKLLPIQSVVGSTIYKPTMKLRWFVTEVYIPELDDFEKVLQQCWLDDKGEEIWEDVPEFNR